MGLLQEGAILIENAWSNAFCLSNNLINPQKAEVPFQKLEKRGEGKYSEVKIPINDPDVVVKVARTNWQWGASKGDHPLAYPDRIKADLDILKENFGEYVPDSQLVIGKNERGEKTVYIIQDRIKGSNLAYLKYDSHIADQLKFFLNRVIDIYIGNLVYNGNDPRPQSIFPDLRLANFIFGKDKKRNDESDKLYFIDTYPVERTYPQDFVDYYLPRIRNRFSRDWEKVADGFQNDAADKIRRYLQENKDKIKKVDVTN